MRSALLRSLNNTNSSVCGLLGSGHLAAAGRMQFLQEPLTRFASEFNEITVHQIAFSRFPPKRGGLDLRRHSTRGCDTYMEAELCALNWLLQLIVGAPPPQMGRNSFLLF